MNLNEDILQLDKSIYELAQDVNDFCKDESFQEDFKDVQSQIRGQVNAIKDKLLEKYHDFVQSWKERKSFKKKYKKMFFASSVYCTFMLLLVGFEDNYQQRVVVILFYAHITIIALILYVFASGFLNSKNKSKVLCPNTIIVLLIVLLAYLLGFILSFVETHYLYLNSELYINPNTMLIISVVIAIMPYTLFFIMAYYYRENNKKFRTDFLKELDKADSEISKVVTQGLLQYYKSAKKNNQADNPSKK